MDVTRAFAVCSLGHRPPRAALRGRPRRNPGRRLHADVGVMAPVDAGDAGIAFAALADAVEAADGRRMRVAMVNSGRPPAQQGTP
jgi:hypothetical protein